MTSLRIILERPPAGIDYALQEGKGRPFDVVQKQRSKGRDLEFEFTVDAQTTKRPGKGGGPNFLGPFVQGPVGERFVYINIGTYAGQTETCWSRRLKIPLRGITWDMLRSGKAPAAHVPGTGKDGSPSCAYAWRKEVGPSWQWQLGKSSKRLPLRREAP